RRVADRRPRRPPREDRPRAGDPRRVRRRVHRPRAGGDCLRWAGRGAGGHPADRRRVRRGGYVHHHLHRALVRQILIDHPRPHFAVQDVYAGWAEALRALGQDVYAFNLDDRLAFYDRALVEVDGVKDEDGRPGVRKALSREQAIQLAANGILSACYQCWPDVGFLVSAFFTPPGLLEVMRARGHRIVLLHTESPYQDGEQLVRAACADLNLVNDPSNLGAYRELGPAAYMPHAYRPAVHYPDPGAAK